MAKRKQKPKRKRRTYSNEFKQDAVQLVVTQGLSIAEAARNLGIHPNLLRSWKEKLAAEDEDAELTEEEQMELARLRAENKRLRMERDILKKATAFFANEKN
jgi:transposase